jgi:hypothetical protein
LVTFLKARKGGQTVAACFFLSLTNFNVVDVV